MRAVVVREPGLARQVMRVETVPDPVPGRRDVIIKVESCGICFHDVVACNGTMKAGVEMPIIPGHEIAGRVVEIGADVGGMRVGDMVATTQRYHVCGGCRFCRTGREPLCDEGIFLGDVGLNGGYAQFVAVEADNVVPVPDGVPIESAAIASCAIGTMYHAIIEVGKVRPGERVLMTGAGGGLGMHGLQVARSTGAYVMAVTSSADKVAAIRDAGAHDVVVADRGDDFSEVVRELTSGEGVDVAIDNVGSPAFPATRRSIGKGGRWVLVGQLGGDFVPFNPAQLFLKGISLLSATSTTRDELRRCLDLLARGAVRGFLTETVPLEEVPRVHEALERGGVLGRAIVRP
ncbi:2-desacetyl-2-hydroxyethyl bacteriochlorophyllide A dehydrogenase [Mesorhizobium sp. J18]|uniref:alcohol dehydrogenase catalytic domain-containing protein n=1 Tax=Mesorhizobium sp. J18 TaxID=935263 RepID=UPI001198D8A3|nr:alcohol dehydrogenase catalytic domain-containing protein [Mesorhizobium sp. J18]TWG94254.1 2-desacetyl-2-hydroxyethyl bacteriochlorophyllide A dehydrogenase [Mesorhizobium sp. J18]